MRPLDGLRVLDFTRHMAGPYAALALSDYGADVIKVESIGSGDPSRRTGVDFLGDQSALFLIWNRGKRSIAIDLRSPKGLEAVLRLVPTVDVVLENYRPGQADRYGIGYEALSALNERLVYCSISAFGQEGPLAPFPGTDPVVQAASGVMGVTGEPDRGPSLVGIPIADFTGAQQAVQGILMALLVRERTGRGQKVEISLLAGLLSALTTRLASHWTTGEDPQRFGSAHSIVVPYEAFQTADGWAVAGVWGGNDGWGPFCDAVGLPELKDDERFLRNEDRVRLRAELRPVLQSELAKRTTAEWEERFRSGGVLFHPVYTFSEILGHPQVAAAGLVTSMEHPTSGTIPQLAPVIGLSETPGALTIPPPLLGQHTTEILGEAGYGDAAIERLVEEGVVEVREAS
jgi:crotonobetainyl-CoA:carnitine CoA-transferase CaiB-like acyl-CoA transferase